MWGSLGRWWWAALCVLGLGVGCEEEQGAPGGSECTQDEDCGYLLVCEQGACVGLRCGLERAPVCGSDWLTYQNACHARVSHTDILGNSACSSLFCESDDECFGRRCSTAEVRCVECLGDEDCAADERCNATGWCEAEVRCGADEDCPREARCDLTRQSCDFDCRLSACAPCNGEISVCGGGMVCERDYCRTAEGGGGEVPPP